MSSSLSAIFLQQALIDLHLSIAEDNEYSSVSQTLMCTLTIQESYENAGSCSVDLVGPGGADESLTTLSIRDSYC